MTPISANLQAVRARIAAACKAVGRAPQAVALLAVSKTWPAADV
ncbi:MAG TPA: YggS family pyridoxal phosphate enzyme, partial [Rhodocyclaceae bacterium]|nr:YggS family pyridoxal phosphate enzyme [Rhodocyclaceae bacterium]